MWNIEQQFVVSDPIFKISFFPFPFSSPFVLHLFSLQSLSLLFIFVQDVSRAQPVDTYVYARGPRNRLHLQNVGFLDTVLSCRVQVYKEYIGRTHFRPRSRCLSHRLSLLRLLFSCSKIVAIPCSPYYTAIERYIRTCRGETLDVHASRPDHFRLRDPSRGEIWQRFTRNTLIPFSATHTGHRHKSLWIWSLVFHRRWSYCLEIKTKKER